MFATGQVHDQSRSSARHEDKRSGAVDCLVNVSAQLIVDSDGTIQDVCFKTVVRGHIYVAVV